MKITVKDMHNGQMCEVIPVLYRDQLGCVMVASACCINALELHEDGWRLSTMSIGPTLRVDDLEALEKGMNIDRGGVAEDVLALCEESEWLTVVALREAKEVLSSAIEFGNEETVRCAERALVRAYYARALYLLKDKGANDADDRKSVLAQLPL